MLRLAVALSLVAICCAQTRPDLSNTFTSAVSPRRSAHPCIYIYVLQRKLCTWGKMFCTLFCRASTSTTTLAELSLECVSGSVYIASSRCMIFSLLTVILDRDESKNMGVENATYKVGDLTEHYELLQLYNTGEQYTVRE